MRRAEHDGGSITIDRAIGERLITVVKLTVTLRSNIGPHALMIRCSNCFANSRYPNPAGRTLTLLHRRELASVRVSMPKRTEKYTSIMIPKEI
jgi:hypothetical protein